MAGSDGVISKEEWEKRLNKVRHRKGLMDKLVMNFLVAEGYKEAAENFQLETGAENINPATMPERMAVLKAVQSGNMEDAIGKINHFYPSILKVKDVVDFLLHQQLMIELIQNGKLQEALEVSRKKLALIAVGYPTLLVELKRTLVLLVFGNDPNSPVADLLNASRYLKIANEVNVAILTSQGYGIDTTLPFLLKLLRLAQSMLSHYAVYPQIEDLSTGVLGDPTGD